jgi:hypothetical protein
MGGGASPTRPGPGPDPLPLILAALLLPPDHQAKAKPEGLPKAPEHAEGRPQGEAQVEVQGWEEVAPSMPPMAAVMKNPGRKRAGPVSPGHNYNLY